MARFQPRYDVTVRPGLGSLPIGLRFVGLIQTQGIETLRIRFALDHDKLLDLPLSAEALVALVQPLSALRGKGPDEIPDEIESLYLPEA